MALFGIDTFCRDTVDKELVANCLKSGGDTTYLHWFLTAWGTALALALLAVVLFVPALYAAWYRVKRPV